MLKQFSPRQKVLLLILGGLFALLLIFFSQLTPPSPIITKTKPLDKAVDVPLLPTIELHFDRDITLSDITLSVAPFIDLRSTLTSPTTITFVPTSPLTPTTTYVFSVSILDSSPYQFSFTTQSTQTDQALLDRLNSELDRDYPLAAKTPYETPQFRVVYSAPLTLKITLKSSALTPDSATNQVQDWVKARGINPTTHQYIVE
jgi:hypothetical protein